jgi:talin
MVPLMIVFSIDRYIPVPWRKEGRRMEKEIYAEHKKLTSLSEVNGKFRYVQKVRALRTFGITFYECLERAPGKKKDKWVPVLIGITRDRILRLVSLFCFCSSFFFRIFTLIELN